MKKQNIWVITVALLLAVAVLSFFFTNTVSIDEGAQATLCYKYGDKDIDVKLTEEESKTIRDILDGESLTFESGLSCGFNDDIYIRFSDGLSSKTFYPVCDECSFLKYNEKVLSVEDDEMETLHEIMDGYGATWPCI